MDVGKIYESLDLNLKTVFLSIAICFPIAYLDLWVMLPKFRFLVLWHEIIFALGGSIFLCYGGILTNVVIIFFSAIGKRIKHLNLVPIISPTILASFISFVLFREEVYSKIEFFWWWWVGSAAIVAGLGLIVSLLIYNQKQRQKQKKQKNQSKRKLPPTE